MRKSKSYLKKGEWVNALFLFPCVFAFLMVIVIPFSLGIYYSLTDWNGVKSEILFIGFKNFEGIFKTTEFGHSLLLTTIYTIINIALVNVVSFLLSLLVTSNLKLRNLYRAGFFVPNLIGGIVLGYIWQFLFNNALTPALFPKSLIARADTVIWAMSFVNTWQYAGYIMMIYVAAIQGIPQSLMEAANVDGASYFTRLRKILIPLMANSFTISLFLTLTNSFKQFDMNLTLTNGGPATRFLGTPARASELLAMNIYNEMGKNQLAIGQAKSVVFFLILVVISLAQVYISKRREVEM